MSETKTFLASEAVFMVDPPMSVTVPMGEFTTMLKAVAPHVYKEADYSLIRFQFAGETLVLFTGGPYGLVAGKVPVLESVGLTGDPSHDHVLVPADTAAKLVGLFKPKKVDGEPDPMAQLELRIEPITENVRANKEEFELARREQRPLHEEKLKAPAKIHVTDTSGMIPGNEFTAPLHPYDNLAGKYPGQLRNLTVSTPMAPKPMFGLSGPALTAYGQTSKILAHRLVVNGTEAATLNVAIGEDFRGVIPATTLTDDEADLEKKLRGIWIDLFEETR